LDHRGCVIVPKKILDAWSGCPSRDRTLRKSHIYLSAVLVNQRAVEINASLDSVKGALVLALGVGHSGRKFPLSCAVYSIR